VSVLLVLSCYSGLLMDVVVAARKSQEMIDCFRDLEKWLREEPRVQEAKPRLSNDQLRELANQQYRLGRFAEAVDSYTTLLSRVIEREQRSVVLSNRAQSFLALRKYTECVNDASESIKIKLSDKALFRRAQGLVGLGRYDEAERDLIACRNITVKSDLNTRQRVDEKLADLRREKLRKREEMEFKARFMLCTQPPEWTLSVCESEFRDVVVDGMERMTKVETVIVPQVIQPPKERYVPRSMRLSNMTHVH
jgi:hypothetical protein